MKYSLKEAGETLVIALEGNFTFSDHSHFRGVLERLHKGAHKESVFDLAGLNFIDSTGLGLLVMANDIANRKGFSVRLIQARGRVRTLLDRAEFGTIMTVE